MLQLQKLQLFNKISHIITIIMNIFFGFVLMNVCCMLKEQRRFEF